MCREEVVPRQIQRSQLYGVELVWCRTHTLLQTCCLAPVGQEWEAGYQYGHRRLKSFHSTPRQRLESSLDATLSRTR